MRGIRQTIRRRCHGSPRPRDQNHGLALVHGLARPELCRYGRLRRCPYRQEILASGWKRLILQGNKMKSWNIYNTTQDLRLTTYDLLRSRMDSLQEIYTKYDKIIKYSAYAFTGWFLSWVLFFIMLPFMVRYYGKIRGASLNYGFSWFSMIAIILGLEFGLQRWKSLESDKYNPLKRTLFGHFSDFQTYKIQRISLNDFLAENISFEIWSPKIEDSVDSKVTPSVLGVQIPVFGGMDW